MKIQRRMNWGYIPPDFIEKIDPEGSAYYNEHDAHIFENEAVRITVQDTGEVLWEKEEEK